MLEKYQYIGILKNEAGQIIARIGGYSMESFEGQLYKLEDAEKKDRDELKNMVDDLDERQREKIKKLIRRKYKF